MPHLSRRGDKRVEMGHRPDEMRGLRPSWGRCPKKEEKGKKRKKGISPNPNSKLNFNTSRADYLISFFHVQCLRNLAVVVIIPLNLLGFKFDFRLTKKGINEDQTV
jgi:hypothetical protein